MRDWLRLTKPGIVVSNALMAAAGAALAPATLPVTIVQIVLGTAGLVAGCGALNMVMERTTDRRMPRTAGRPVADRRVTPAAATIFGAALILAGALLLAPTTWAGLGFGLLATFVYLGVYTPLKRRTWWAVPAGAVAGALPPVIGWAAAGGVFDAVPLFLFAILFVWQLPHFIAIGVRRYRDYEAAGLHIGVPPLARRNGLLGARVLSLALFPLTVGLGLALPASVSFWVLSLVAAAGMTAVSFRGMHDPDAWAKRVFLASLAYLLVFSAGVFLA